MTGSVSVSVAARMAGVRPYDIVRRCASGQFPQAFRGGLHGEWRIPVTDLVASDLDVESAPFGPLTTVDDLTPLTALARATEMIASSVQVWLDAAALETYSDGDGANRVLRATRLLADAVDTWNVCATTYVAET